MINRKGLYAGVFLLAAGSVMLLAQGNAGVRDTVADALRLWPLALIALGAALLLRRTRLGIAGGLMAAAVPGLLLGGVVVAAPTVVPICDDDERAGVTTRQGTFGHVATVDLSLACGELTVGTTPGDTWRLEIANLGRASASVVESTDRLVLSSVARRGWFHLDQGDAWQLWLPTESLLDLVTELNAGRAVLDLAGARLGDVTLTAKAGEARLDLSDATLDRLTVGLSAGSVSVRLPATGEIRGDLSVAAGELEICAPSGLGIRVRGDVALGTTTFNGLIRVNDAWETPGYSSATAHADLSVSASVGSVVINPEGGCK